MRGMSVAGVKLSNLKWNVVVVGGSDVKSGW